MSPLDATLFVSPYDARAMAHAMQQALAMPTGEWRERHQPTDAREVATA